MARLVSYKASLRGMKILANSREIDADLERRAHQVAQVAQSGFDADPPNTGRVVVEVLQQDSDSDRARVAVIARHPIALRIEAERRILGSAIGAAR